MSLIKNLIIPLAAGCLIFLVGLSSAQQSPPSELALQQRLSREINEGISCETKLIIIQRQLDDALKQIEELKKVKDDK